MEDDLEFPAWMNEYVEALSAPRNTAKTHSNPTSFRNSKDTHRMCQPSYHPSQHTNNFEQKQCSSTSLTSIPKEDAASSLFQANDIAVECDKLLKIAESRRNYLVLGLNLDWPSSYTAVLAKTSSIHLCYGENQCLLFKLVVKKLPKAFVALIKHPNVRLIGHNIVEDLLKVGRDFGIDVKQVISSNLLLDSSFGEKLSCEHHWSYKPFLEDLSNQREEEPVNTNSSVRQTIEAAEFRGELKYSTTFEDCAAFSEELLARADEKDQLVLGFDLEWPIKYSKGSAKAALIQICPDETVCYLFHVFDLKSLPKALVVLLNHTNVHLTGISIANDIRKLVRDFKVQLGIALKNSIELCTYANEKLRCQHRWSLAGLAANQLKLDVDKGSVRISNWGNTNLTKQQLQYAATDAYIVKSISYSQALLHLLFPKYSQCCSYGPKFVELRNEVNG